MFANGLKVTPIPKYEILPILNPRKEPISSTKYGHNFDNDVDTEAPRHAMSLAIGLRLRFGGVGQASVVVKALQGKAVFVFPKGGRRPRRLRFFTSNE
uniref:Uncharacterized protein n=1 Tax=Panagrellus redivivus TaxID=6233 RepID=A0A7E4UUR2_PANRE